MKSFASIAALSVLLVAVSGCGVQGTWRMQQIEPATAAGHMEFGVIRLADDGTFTADVKYEDKTRDVGGTYTYDCASKLLTFKAKDGTVRTYHAKRGMDGKLRVWNADEPERWEARFVKE